MGGSFQLLEGSQVIRCEGQGLAMVGTEVLQGFHGDGTESGEGVPCFGEVEAISSGSSDDDKPGYGSLGVPCFRMLRAKAGEEEFKALAMQIQCGGVLPELLMDPRGGPMTFGEQFWFARLQAGSHAQGLVGEFGGFGWLALIGFQHGQLNPRADAQNF